VTLQFPKLDTRADLPFYAGAGPRVLPHDRAFARIRVFYNLPGFSKQRVFDKYFYTIKDRTGNFQWFHDDSDHPWKASHLPQFQNLSSKRRLIDLMAFLEVAEVGVQNISETKSERPLQITYMLRNIGGLPATDANIEWAVLNDRTLTTPSIRHVWTNTAPMVAMKELLLPQTFKPIAMRYPDPQHPELFDGIMTGKFTLIGAVRFKDLDGHDYSAFIRADHIGKAFEVKYLHMGGYFEVIKKLAAPVNSN